jgi:uncharacterized protein YjbI with pentapeptide repeats
MLKKNLTPFLFGAKLTSRRPPQPEMTAVVRATFALSPGAPLTPLRDLDQGHLTAEVFEEGDDKRLGECIYPGDFADYKLNAEVMLRGTCYAPGGKPLTECPVRFSVGGWSKILRVVGPRVWSDSAKGAVMSSPLAFTQMPVTYANSFGGPGYAKNPAGKGYGTSELPTIESAAQPVRSKSDQLEPAGFGPLNPAWPQRSGKVGKSYGKAYRETRAPYYAEDFDWSYFSAAPPDQQIQGYLRGDEEISLHNLHKDAPTLTARLPGIRVRVFVNDVEKRFREVGMSLDTLFVDTDKSTIVLTWRGVDKVRETDLRDVVSVLIASEPLEERPQPERSYQALLEEFERDPTGIASAISKDDAEILDRARREKAGEALPADLRGEELDPVSAVLQRKLGGAKREEQEKVREAMKGALALPRPQAETTPKVDVAGEVAKGTKEPAEEPPIAVSAKPGAIPNLRLRDKVRSLMAKVEELKKAAAESKADLKGTEKLDEIPNNPAWKALDPEYTPPGPLPTDEPGPGRDLSERDFTGKDLRGVDLSGATLRGTIFTRANLTGAKLTGADLTNAILFKADLSGADLARADLTKANAAEARLSDANMTGAKLDQAFFEEASLAGATLEEAAGEYAVFTKANMTGVKARYAALERCDLSEATLERASFAGASLVGCLFAKCRGKQVDMGDAQIHGASFADAVLREARFVRARGERCSFLRAALDGADFGFSSMIASHFSEVSADGARFFGANLRECRFYRASLERADVSRANLFSADLCKSKLTSAKFTGASLYDAKFLQASGAGCDFTGANLKRSTLEQA